MSNSSGFSQYFSSWFAEPMLTTIVAPAFTSTPSTTVSRVAVRMIVSSGGSHRRPSSIACGISVAIGAQRVELVGVRQQTEQQVARRAVRGLRAGREQQAEERDDLVVGEALAVELGLHEHADDVVLGVPCVATR